MTLIERVLNYKNLPDKAFLQRCGLQYDRLSDDINGLIHHAYSEKDADSIEACLFLVFRFKCYSVALGELLNKLILEDWHLCHEDMASILQELKMPSSVEPLYLASKMKHQYLEYDNSHGLASKCIWALGAIGNDEAMDRLKMLSTNEDEVIARFAQKQLERKEKG